jgi:uncharacterized protein YaaQ
MKLLLVIAQENDRMGLIEGLVAAGFQATILASTGGFLRKGNVTVLIGVEERRLEEALELVQTHCRVREQIVNTLAPVVEPIGISSSMRVRVGGAIAFVLATARMVKV